jgi:hypothetical protein
VKQLQRAHGVTLLEVLLAIAVAGSIVVLALRSYSTLTEVGIEQQLLMNVDTIFDAAGRFYYYECTTWNQNIQGSTWPLPGLIDPAGTTPPSATDPTPIDMTIDAPLPFISGFLNVSLIKATPLVTNGGGTYMNGYYAQFNPITRTNTNLTSCTSTNNCTVTSITPSPGTKIVNFVIQVGVQLASSLTSTQLTQYKNLLGADCLSSLEGNTGIVHPCADNVSGSILVFTRLPSRASPNAASPIWQMLPTMKQFNVQYNHDQLYELSSPTGSAYYTCGS